MADALLILTTRLCDLLATEERLSARLIDRTMEALYAHAGVTKARTDNTGPAHDCYARAAAMTRADRFYDANLRMASSPRTVAAAGEVLHALIMEGV